MAEKLLPLDELWQAYPKINDAIDNANTAKTQSDNAVNTANQASTTANEAKAMSEDTQNQLDTIIVESGTSDAEVLQARGGFQVLNDRMNNTDAQLADIPTLADTYPATNKVRYIAHRGASVYAPENTIPAFVQAGKAGFWGVECDISPTSDGVWVIMHDLTVDRMTDGTGNVSDLTFAQIQALTIDSGANIGFHPNLKVPTLEEYLNICKIYDTTPIIELKDFSYTASHYDSLVALIRKHNFEEKCIVISGGLSFLQEIRNRSSRLVLQWVSVISEANIDILKNLGNAGIGVSYTGVTKSLIEQAHSAGIHVNAFTVNGISDAKRLINDGIDFISSDRLAGVK